MQGGVIPLGDLGRLGKGSRVASVGNGAHRGSTAEDCDTLVESTDRNPWICRGTRFIQKGRN